MFKDEELADFHALCESNSGTVTSTTAFPSAGLHVQHPTSLLQARTLQCASSRQFPTAGLCYVFVPAEFFSRYYRMRSQNVMIRKRPKFFDDSTSPLVRLPIQFGKDSD